MKRLISFHGDDAIKKEYVKRLTTHYKADEIIKGTYWHNGKGCAVGCTVHSDDHSSYETLLGIPIIIARLEDRIFEGMSNAKAKEFPLEFIKAIPVGVDLSPVWKKFLIWILVDPTTGVIKHAKTESGKKSIQDVANLIDMSLTETITSDQFWQVRQAAQKERAAYAYAAYAYAAAAYAYAADADAAAYAYAAAAYAADAAAYAYAADADARKNTFDQMAEKLIELLKQS